MAFGQIYQVSYFGEVNDGSFGSIYPYLVKGRKLFTDTIKILVDTIRITTDKIKL